MYLIPEGRVGAGSQRIAQTTFDGASFFLEKPVTFNRIIFRITAKSGSPTVAILIYQSTGGGSGTANRKATCTTVAIGAAGNFAATPIEGTVSLEPGWCFALFGRDSVGGSATFQTYTVQIINLLTGNVDSATHPTSFITTIAANTTPAIFDPLGVAVSASSSDVVPVIRIKKV